MAEGIKEEGLIGDGVMPGVVPIGDIVRRPVRQYAATVQAFLEHLLAAHPIAVEESRVGEVSWASSSPRRGISTVTQNGRCAGGLATVRSLRQRSDTPGFCR
jgi:hypothetical protein